MNKIFGFFIAAVLMTGLAYGQNPAPGNPLPEPVATMSVPAGYTVHEAVDLGGRVSNVMGSPAMYGTLVNLGTGPRVQGETFELRALPGTKNTIVDSLKAYGSGFGGDPYSYAKIDFYKGKLYQFTGMFRRDRQYFDYDLLGNPNINTGLSIPIGPSKTPTSSFAWPQIQQSPELFNTVRRMTDTNLTLFPLAKVTFRAGYSQNIFQGPSLTPSGYQFAGSYSLMLSQLQRNSTDDFTGAVEWKPVQGTRLTFEEQVDHFKANSTFSLAPSAFLFQEPDGTKVVPLISFDSETAYGVSACNTGSMGSAYTSSSNYTILTPAQSPHGLPVINPACAVAISYARTQPTRILYPTEMFRLQSSSIRNVTMNGDVRYTSANMNLPNYFDNFLGLTHASNANSAATRAILYLGNANAKRAVVGVDYGIVWQVAPAFSIEDQVDYSDAHEPGISYMSGGYTMTTTGAPNQSLTYGSISPTSIPDSTSTFGGSAAIGGSMSGFFGQKFLTNNLTGSWDVTPRLRLGLTYRYGTHTIATNATGETATNFSINENGGILRAAVRVTKDWEINGSTELAYFDNVLTPVAPRQLLQYRVHTRFRMKPWATFTAGYNDRERHNNTNNAQADGTTYYGPLGHLDHSRVANVGAEIAPNEHYALSLSYGYTDVYTTTNICYNNAATATLPGTALAPGSNVPANVYANGVCAGVFGHGGATLVDWYGRDFMDAPTQYGAVSVMLNPTRKLQSNVGYRATAVSGSEFFTDARSVNGSLNSTYLSPFANVSWKFNNKMTWKAEYNYFGYGEGGPSGSQYCSTSTSASAAVVPCGSLPAVTGLTEPTSGLTAPRNFHANNVTLGVHYEF